MNTDLQSVNSVDESQDNIQPTDAEKRLFGIYNQISGSNDPGEMLAVIMTTTEEFTYGLLKANEVNGRQGKNRYTVTHGTYQTNNNSLDLDVNEYVQKRFTDTITTVLNSWLQDKQELPTNKPKLANGILSKVKSLYLMLFFTNNYDIIETLTTPPYLRKTIKKVFNTIHELGVDAFDRFMTKLEDLGEYGLIESLSSVGDQIWGTPQTKSIAAFRYYVMNHFTTLINHDNESVIYEYYLAERAQWKKSGKAGNVSELYDMFELSRDQYNSGKRSLYNELTELMSGENQVMILNSLLNEN